MVRTGTLNIRSRRNANLDCALRGCKLMGMDIVVLTETKIVDERYTCFSQGYEIHASKAISTSQGGVALAIRKDRGQTWDVEDLTVEWGNIIGCTLVSGQWQKWLIGVYLPPSQFGGGTLDLLTQTVEAAEDPTMVLGDFNANLAMSREAQQRGPLSNGGRQAEQQQVEVLATVACLGLGDMARAFRQRASTGTWTWLMKRDGHRVRSTWTISWRLETKRSGDTGSGE
jgi:exonuclease III